MSQANQVTINCANSFPVDALTGADPTHDEALDCPESYPMIRTPIDCVRNFNRGSQECISALLGGHVVFETRGRNEGKKNTKKKIQRQQNYNYMLNIDALHRASKEHNNKHQIYAKFQKRRNMELRKKGGQGSGHCVTNQVIIRNVATFQDVRYMQCRESKRLFSCRHADQIAELSKRGFEEVFCNHITAPGLSELPKAWKELHGTDDNEHEPVMTETGVPVQPTLPDMSGYSNGSFIPLVKMNKQETTAAALVRSFEDYVEVDGQKYSPYCLWTDQLRKDAGMVTGSGSMWMKRNKAYWMIKQMLLGSCKEKGVPTPLSAQDIKLSQSELEKKATSYHQEYCKTYGTESTENSPSSGNWENRAMKIAKDAWDRKQNPESETAAHQARDMTPEVPARRHDVNQTSPEIHATT